jgi:hypothetical protein
MNLGSENRFHELARKVLGKEAQAMDLEDLRVMIARYPALKADFERLRAEIGATREILPLLEDIQHPQREVPPAPLPELRQAVQDVFGGNSAS